MCPFILCRGASEGKRNASANPSAVVKYKTSPARFQDASLTWYGNLAVVRVTLCVLASTKANTSSRLPTATCAPSGLHATLMFSSVSATVATARPPARTSQKRRVLSAETVARRSGELGSQLTWSTESLCPLSSTSRPECERCSTSYTLAV